MFYLNLFCISLFLYFVIYEPFNKTKEKMYLLDGLLEFI